jgi:putative zinc finger/helix-turn-helix YgiT family protein
LSDASSEKVTQELRQKAGLLTPTQIRENRKRLGLNQEQLANLLRVAKETVSRWETGGQIQQRAMDLLLRMFFDVPQVRHWLGHPGTPLISTPAS